jgi:transposase
MSTRKKPSPDSIVHEIKRKTRRKSSAEEKIRIVLEALRGEQSITDLCRPLFVRFLLEFLYLGF